MTLIARMHKRHILITCFLALVFQGWMHFVWAGLLSYEEEQRLQVSLKLFPAFLAADLDLAQRVGKDGRLLVLVVDDDGQDHADMVSANLRSVGKIQDFPLSIRVVDAEELHNFKDRLVAGIFVVSPGLDGQLFNAWAQQFQNLVFSPFTGDVERGAVAGLFTGARILPYVNQTQLKRAGVRLKPFFLRVAEQYE